MITYLIKGPKDAVVKAASRLSLMHHTEGKIVRIYKDASKAPSPLPADSDIIILIEPEATK